MLATIAALQLAVLSQVPPPPPLVTPEEAMAAQVPGGAPAEVNPPLPRREDRPGPAAAPPAASTAPTPLTVSPRQLSLLSAEPLRGGAAALAWAGWSSLGIMYGQGITLRDDLAGFADFDWAKTELRLGGFYRRPLGRAGPFDMAGRLAAAWYLNFGGRWIHGENRSDRGVELAPGLSLSRRGAGGIFSGIAEAPLTVTTRFGAGLLFSPRFSVAYEAPLYPELTVGARLGAGYRAGAGDAPLRDGRAELLFLVVASYRVL
jgi:hypothetical protein